jgi:hypothetical protein
MKMQGEMVWNPDTGEEKTSCRVPVKEEEL